MAHLRVCPSSLHLADKCTHFVIISSESGVANGSGASSLTTCVSIVLQMLM